MLQLPAPGKLNLFLHVIGKRDDGYHLLESVMQFVDLCDQLSFELLPRPDIVFGSNYQAVSADDNLVVRAARLLQSYVGIKQGARIYLDKVLPVGAGMGGGSSDAATTLIGLNHLWQLALSVEQLMQLGEQLGADVPFFIKGKAGWVTGIGECIEPIELPTPYYLLVMPDVHVTTADLFQSTQLQRDCAPLSKDSYQLGMGENVFLPIVYEKYPAIRKAYDWLSRHAEVKLTGTGAVLFSVIDTAEEVSRIAALVPDGLRCLVACGLNQSPLQSAVM
jgi:4-diphosphocytidyl-2-C-methyl-D-erythritol kinase